MVVVLIDCVHGNVVAVDSENSVPNKPALGGSGDTCMA